MFHFGHGIQYESNMQPFIVILWKTDIQLVFDKWTLCRKVARTMGKVNEEQSPWETDLRLGTIRDFRRMVRTGEFIGLFMGPLAWQMSGSGLWTGFCNSEDHGKDTGDQGETQANLGPVRLSDAWLSIEEMANMELRDSKSTVWVVPNRWQRECGRKEVTTGLEVSFKSSKWGCGETVGGVCLLGLESSSDFYTQRWHCREAALEMACWWL